MIPFDQRVISQPRTSLPAGVSMKVSQSVCAAAATKLGGDHSRQVSSKDWDALKAEIGNFLDTKKGSSHDGLRDVLWFLFSVARQRAAAQARRRKKRSKIVTHQFFHSVSFR